MVPLQLVPLQRPEETINPSELHTFCDASEEAFAASVYKHNRHESGEMTTNLIIAKTKLAPKKTVSVAKLEHQAALLGVRQADKVLACLASKIEKRWFWTDSSCARNWIRSPAAYYKPTSIMQIRKQRTNLKEEFGRGRGEYSDENDEHRPRNNLQTKVVSLGYKHVQIKVVI